YRCALCLRRRVTTISKDVTRRVGQLYRGELTKMLGATFPEADFPECGAYGGDLLVVVFRELVPGDVTSLIRIGSPTAAAVRRRGRPLPGRRGDTPVLPRAISLTADTADALATVAALASPRWSRAGPSCPASLPQVLTARRQRGG